MINKKVKTLESINQLSDKISNNPSIPNKKENFIEKINTTQNDKIKRYELDISKNFFVINNNKTKHIFEITKVENINIIKIKECIILPQKQKELEIKAEKRSFTEFYFSPEFLKITYRNRRSQRTDKFSMCIMDIF